MNCEEHLSFVSKEFSSSIFALQNEKKYCSAKTLLITYYGIIDPHIKYSIIFGVVLLKYRVSQK